MYNTLTIEREPRARSAERGTARAAAEEREVHIWQQEQWNARKTDL
jgi:hypothetical protein